jgi:hypothetical protein
MLPDDPGIVIHELEILVVNLKGAAGGIPKAGQIVRQLDVRDAPGILVRNRYWHEEP